MNEVQKNFNKQMNQGLKELKRKDKDAYHEYIKRNHLDDAKSRIAEETRQEVVSAISAPFKILLKFIGLVVIIAIGYNFLKGVSSQKQSYSVNTLAPVTYGQSQIRTTKQKQIIDYMNFISPIIIRVNQEVDLRNKALENVNKKLLTRNEYKNDITVYANRINTNIIQIESASCPKVLESYKNILLIQYSSLIEAIKNEIQYVNSGNESFRSEIAKNVEEYRTKSKDAQQELNSILKDNKLK